MLRVKGGRVSMGEREPALVEVEGVGRGVRGRGGRQVEVVVGNVGSWPPGGRKLLRRERVSVVGLLLGWGVRWSPAGLRLLRRERVGVVGLLLGGGAIGVVVGGVVDLLVGGGVRVLFVGGGVGLWSDIDSGFQSEVVERFRLGNMRSRPALLVRMIVRLLLLKMEGLMGVEETSEDAKSASWW